MGFFFATRKFPKYVCLLTQFSIDGFLGGYHKEALRDTPEAEY